MTSQAAAPITCYALCPLDVLHFGGNRGLGTGQHGSGRFPPWPSQLSGALRAAELQRAGGEAVEAFRERRLGERAAELARLLGEGPGERGTFRLRAMGLARHLEEEVVDPLLLPLPADLAVYAPEDDTGGEGGERPEGRRAKRVVLRAEPRPLPEGVRGSFGPLPQPLRFDPTEAKGKPLGGYWLTTEGIEAWQCGDTPERRQLLEQGKLWQDDARLGIGMDPARRTTEEGLLYTARFVALAKGVSLVAAVGGGPLARLEKAEPALLRLGGEGRAARIERMEPKPAERLERMLGYLPKTDGFRLWLIAPGLFEAGWLPTGCEERDGAVRWKFPSRAVARLVAAAVPGHETVSGWDMARRRPKPARRIAPAGSVYVFQWEEGSREARREALADLAQQGVLLPKGETARVPEGWNQVLLGDWRPDGTPGAEERRAAG